MGSASSKASRSLSKTKPSTVRTPNISERPPLATEKKNEAVEADSKDPHFLGNLNRLGPVRVVRDVQNSLSASSRVNQTLKLREESEKVARAATTPRNRLLASDLIEMLDGRKGARSVGDLDRLAAMYGVDRDVLESLGRYVNSPSEDQATRRKVVDPEDGSETVLTSAIWVSPRIS